MRLLEFTNILSLATSSVSARQERYFIRRQAMISGLIGDLSQSGQKVRNAFLGELCDSSVAGGEEAAVMSSQFLVLS
jgi:hypothetical protein